MVLFQNMDRFDDLGGFSAIRKNKGNIICRAGRSIGHGNVKITGISDIKANAEKFIIEVHGNQSGSTESEQADRPGMDYKFGNFFQQRFIQ